ncbi:MAG TPA: LCP family protein [Solirubrobacteraceae bacterium]|jgi:LCP family protein required for cell wall assembly|nr:LCP family protein [Solirubrobacteraceae bacterium]
MPGPAGRGMAWRIILGGLIVILCAAGVTATFALEQVHGLQDALRLNPSLNIGAGVLAPTGYGSPETLLLVGNDQRKHTTTTPVLPHSNEMLLVRIDPGKPYISMMSVPRELEVTITPPNQAPITTRLNYAYTAGGIPLLVSTIKQVTGLRVNHVVVIDFNQFKQAVDDLGCVYSTIDRRYLHVNTPTSQQYQEINLQAGYQKLCGTQALEFVSYRHGDTSLVRDARDQSFLLDVKKEYGPTLIGNISKFEHIFGETVQTDAGLKTTDGLLNLIGTLINSASLRVRQVQFQANLVPSTATPCSCVTASAQQISASVDSFLHGAPPSLKQTSAATVRSLHGKHAVAKLPLVATGAQQAESAKDAAGRLPFSYEYPRVQDAGGAGVPVARRDYLIRSPNGAAYPIYTDVFSAGQLGQYYDVQGTTWTGAPLFSNPDQTVSLGGRSYELFYSGQHVGTVAWREHGAAYWIQNSLTDALPNGEMLAIAEQTRPVSAGHGLTAALRVRLRTAAVPKRTVRPTKTSSSQTVGSLAGLLTLLAVPLLAILLYTRRRSIKELRAHLEANLELDAGLRAAIAGHGISASALSPANVSPSALSDAPMPPGRMPPTTTRPFAVAAGAAHGSATRRGTGESAPATAYRRPRRRSRSPVRLLAGAGVVALLVAAGLAVAIMHAGGNAKHPARRATAPAATPPARPTVPVAVLNATQTPDAAGRLAQSLRADGASVSSVGNVTAAGSSGLLVFYAPGEQSQAARVARLLPARAVPMAPISSAVAAAAGSAARVVVVIE